MGGGGGGGWRWCSGLGVLGLGFWGRVAEFLGCQTFSAKTKKVLEKLDGLASPSDPFLTMYIQQV